MTTFFIGGASPHVHNLPTDALKHGKIIGVNRWALDYPCDYWIGLDTGKIWEENRHWVQAALAQEAEVWMRTPNNDTERFVPRDLTEFWFQQANPRDSIPLDWRGQLRWESSTAMAAINLGIIKGAKEIILFGVDFVGGTRSDGTEYSRPDHWEQESHRIAITALMNRFKDIVPIYKTNPDSWLELPYKDLNAWLDEKEPQRQKQHPQKLIQNPPKQPLPKKQSGKSTKAPGKKKTTDT